MSTWNYVVTAHKPTAVTHSCTGHFTGPTDTNLIIAKCTRIEIHILTPQGLQLVQDLPIYGSISTLQLFRSYTDLLLITTEENQYCVLRWDTDKDEVTTWAKGDILVLPGSSPENAQIVTIHPYCKMIGLHLYDGFFTAIPLDDNCQLEEEFDIRLKEFQVLDIKFLYCQRPTIAILYQDNQNVRHIKTYEVASENRGFVEGSLSRSNLDNGADLLIPVPAPFGGVLIIGETVVYLSASAYRSIPIRPAIIKAYGKVDAHRYLLGDHDGLLYLLVITHDGINITGLKIELRGETSIASTISYLDSDVVFVGSSYGDSQLVKLNSQADETGSYVKVLDRYVNLGPIVDFCVLDFERQGQGPVLTCSGAYKDSYLRIIQNKMRIYEEASQELPNISGMWSLKLDTNAPYDTFLVVSFLGETHVLAMRDGEMLEETILEGFIYEAETLFCHDAVYNQFVQVTLRSVMLVSFISGQLLHKWSAPGLAITIATANTTQVLVVFGAVHLVYLEIGDGNLTERKRVTLDFNISCLDINPLGDNPTYSLLAAVGTWIDISVRIYSLPDLNLITTEDIGGTMCAVSVLLCRLGGISYLFCALGDGQLLNFVLNVSTGELADRKKVSLGTGIIKLRTFSSKNATHVFATSTRPTVIYSSNKKLVYIDVNLNNVMHMCPFNLADFPDSLAVVKKDKLSIGKIDDIQKLHIRSIPLGEYVRHICHQEQTHTFAICSFNQPSAEAYEMHFVRLLDDQTFEFLSTYQLNQYEYGRSILSCSFTDDTNVYYCVGTAYEVLEEDEGTKGRILVFLVEDGKLQLLAEKKTKGNVYSVNIFNGKLLAAINQEIQLYEWVLQDDGTRELQFECGHHGHILALFVQTRGDLIVIGDLMKSIYLLIYRHEEGAIRVGARDYNAKWMSAVEILDGDTYLGAEKNCNLFTMRTSEERRRLELVGKYYLGELVHCFRHGSLLMPVPDSDVDQMQTVDVGQIPTVIFGTKNGAIGVIASISHEQYVFFEKLQATLREVIKGVGGLSHEDWRSFSNVENEAIFLDGDLIKSFLRLRGIQKYKVSYLMGIPVEELTNRVEVIEHATAKFS